MATLSVLRKMFFGSSHASVRKWALDYVFCIVVAFHFILVSAPLLTRCMKVKQSPLPWLSYPHLYKWGGFIFSKELSSEGVYGQISSGIPELIFLTKDGMRELTLTKYSPCSSFSLWQLTFAGLLCHFPHKCTVRCSPRVETDSPCLLDTITLLEKE